MNTHINTYIHRYTYVYINEYTHKYIPLINAFCSNLLNSTMGYLFLFCTPLSLFLTVILLASDVSVSNFLVSISPSCTYVSTNMLRFSCGFKYHKYIYIYIYICIFVYKHKYKYTYIHAYIYTCSSSQSKLKRNIYIYIYT